MPDLVDEFHLSNDVTAYGNWQTAVVLYDAAPVCGWHDKVEFWRKSLNPRLSTLADMLLLRGPDRECR